MKCCRLVRNFAKPFVRFSDREQSHRNGDRLFDVQLPGRGGIHMQQEVLRLLYQIRDLLFRGRDIALKRSLTTRPIRARRSIRRIAFKDRLHEVNAMIGQIFLPCFRQVLLAIENRACRPEVS